MESLQRACTLEAELALLLRISHKYGKAGAQVLSSMGALEYLASCKALNMPLKVSHLLCVSNSASSFPSDLFTGIFYNREA